ncbi:amine sulfotransferase-like [Polypterus senegalus]|uniref:amine sulfotransferase-like n=1 Tax=Polypterus senegalus TaxID=55291 RepID=UPI0019669B00|nr:amine sulfotransferase-like [Polypterus senegalus]
MALHRDSNPRVTRWFLDLQLFKFTVIYRRGTLQANTDALSRVDDPMGTVWTQQIVSLIFEDDCTEDFQNNIQRMPWIEFPMDGYDFVNRLSPRLYATHLPYHLAPKALKEKKAKVIYVFRNPKDTMVSYFHFSKMMNDLETIPSITELIERYLNGKGE